MEIQELRRHWDGMGREDPLWAILTAPDKADGRWDPEEFFATGRRDVDSVLRQLDGLGIQAKRGRALDFGCGVGRLTQALAQHFDTVHGVDIASSMIDLAGRYNRFGERCTYHLNEKDDLSIFADGSFDFVLTLICLQHMEPRYSRRYLAEFARIVSPGGVLYFQLPASMTTATRLRRTLGAVAQRLGLGALLRLLRKQPTKPSAYVMEMYAQPAREVVAYLESVGFTVRSAERDSLTGNDFVSYRYVAIRQ
jgi:2-polyprenyl-3-methyl-5-hydroxy-6-metoxy-1,4-benzoquinol methylase